MTKEKYSEPKEFRVKRIGFIINVNIITHTTKIDILLPGVVHCKYYWNDILLPGEGAGLPH